MWKHGRSFLKFQKHCSRSSKHTDLNESLEKVCFPSKLRVSSEDSVETSGGTARYKRRLCF